MKTLSGDWAQGFSYPDKGILEKLFFFKFISIVLLSFTNKNATFDYCADALSWHIKCRFQVKIEFSQN